MKIGIGNDHSAVELKKEIIAYLESMGHEVVNYGTDTTESCNYSDYGEMVANAVVSKEVDKGVLICGTGVGISISANKVRGIRAAVCSEPCTAHLVSQHNNANIIAFGARIVGAETAKMIVKEWLDTPFEDGGRHRVRIDKIAEIESRNFKA
ncbi:MAG: ribose 5-phosphate isomerase B [Lachnospiraceae bacterium]